MVDGSVDYYRSYAASVAEEYGLPTDAFIKLINAESSFRNITEPNDKGAIGIAQIVPKYHPGVNPTDPIASLDYAGKTISEYYSQFGSWEKAFAAWNAGPSAIAKGVIPDETRTELDKVFGNSVSGNATVVAGTVIPAKSVNKVVVYLGFGMVLLFALSLIKPQETEKVINLVTPENDDSEVREELKETKKRFALFAKAAKKGTPPLPKSAHREALFGPRKKAGETSS